MNMGFPLLAPLILLGIGCSYATQIKYIVRSGPFEANPELLADKWRQELQSMVGSADNSIQATTEATYHDCVLDGSCSDLEAEFGAEGTFKPFPQDHLQKILQKFQQGETKLANLYVNDRSDVNEGVQNDNEPQPLPDQPQTIDKSKSWNVVHPQQSHNKHPYDDRQGWVTLEPIAWSSSQIQKWEPNPRPTFPPPNEVANYWNGGPPAGSYGPPVSSERPPWSKPTYEYNTNPKPQWGNKHPSNQNYEYKPTYSSGGSWGGNPDIITDNRPGSFPPDSRPSGSHDNGGGYRPWGSHHNQGSQPAPSYNKPTYAYGSSYSSSSERPNYQSTADGDGHWVLLSSTKGYSIPQRHRSNSRSMNLKGLEDDKGMELPKTITANVVSNMNS